MKKVKSGNGSSAAKGNGAPKNVDEYLAGVPEPARSTLNKIRAAIRSAVPPEATETISYRIPAFKQNGILVYFAAFKHHIGFYPTPSAVRAFANDLSKFATARGSIQFPLEKPLPLALIRKITAFRVRESIKEDRKWRT